MDFTKTIIPLVLMASESIAHSGLRNNCEMVIGIGSLVGSLQTNQTSMSFFLFVLWDFTFTLGRNKGEMFKILYKQRRIYIYVSPCFR